MREPEFGKRHLQVSVHRGMFGFRGLSSPVQNSPLCPWWNQEPRHRMNQEIQYCLSGHRRRKTLRMNQRPLSGLILNMRFPSVLGCLNRRFRLHLQVFRWQHTVLCCWQIRSPDWRFHLRLCLVSRLSEVAKLFFSFYLTEGSLLQSL